MSIEVTETPVTGLYGTGTKKTASSSLGKDDFLTLLTKQLQYQDPLQPMDNLEVTNQMATFSTLEQITNMNTTLTNYLQNSSNNYRIEAMNMLGLTVTAQTGEMSEPVTGTVSSVRFEDGVAIFKVDGGDTEFKIDDIKKMEPMNIWSGLDGYSNTEGTETSTEASAKAVEGRKAT